MQPSTLVVRGEPRPSNSQCFPDGFTAKQTRFQMATELYGSNASWLLLGFLIVQTYLYYKRGAKDHPIFKILLYATIFITIGQSAIESFLAYHYVVGGWGGPNVEDIVVQFSAFQVLSDLQPILVAPPAVFAQLFFTWRIWTFCMAVCGRTVKLLVAAVCLLVAVTSVTAFGLCLTFMGLYLSPNGFPENLISTVILVWSISSAFVDVTITVCMMSILYHARSNTVFEETRNILSRLLRLTIQTGFLTVVIALPVGPLFLKEQDVYIYPILFFLLGKSYMISLLANLNARNTSRQAVVRGTRGDSTVSVRDGHLSTLTFAPGNRKAQTSSEAK